MASRLKNLLALLVILTGCATIYPSMIGTPGVTHLPGTFSMGLNLEFPPIMHCEPEGYQGNQDPCTLLSAVPVFPMLGLDFSIGLPLDMQLDTAVGLSVGSIIPNIRLRVIKMITNSLSGGLEVSGSPKDGDKIIADYISYRALMLYAYPSVYRHTGAYFGIVPQLAQFLQAPNKPVFMTGLLTGFYLDQTILRLRIEAGIYLQPTKTEEDKFTILAGFYTGFSVGFYLYGLPKAEEVNPTPWGFQ